MGIKIETYSLDGLKFETWEFIVIDYSIILQTYRLFTRPTKKHKSINTHTYDKTHKCNLPLSLVPLTDGIRKEALNLFVKSLKVQTWAEYEISRL